MMQKNCEFKNAGQLKNYKVTANLIWNLPHKLFMDKTTLSGRFRIGIRNDFMDKRQMAWIEDPGQKPSGMTLCYRGFTLIELLVVVLIIGILAAVALPQYQKAVLKTKYTQLVSFVEPIYQAEQVYRLATGAYAADFSTLDVIPPTAMVPMEGRITHYKTTDDKIWCYSNANAGTTPTMVACQFHNNGDGEWGAGYVRWLAEDHPRGCYGNENFCKSVTGNNTYWTYGGWHVYDFLD